MTPPRILVTDDTPAFCEALGEMLSLFGYAPAIVCDGAAALAHARSTRPDLILVTISRHRWTGSQCWLRFSGLRCIFRIPASGRGLQE